MPQVGHVHNKAFAVDNGRLYNLGGARGINLIRVFPNGVAFIHIIIAALAMLFWTLPLSQLAGIGFQDAGGLGTLLLLGPPILLAVLSSRKFKQDLSLSQLILIKVNKYIRQSSHYAGNDVFMPTGHKPIIATVFMPIDADQEEN